jgi:transposase
MDASTRFDTQTVGALPVIVEYLERLQVAKTIDRLVPWEGDVPLGTLVEIMIINRLLAPQPLFRLDEWARKTGVAAYYGLDPGQLNDDRLGRALERLPAYQQAVCAGLVLQALRKFRLQVSQVHYDITSVELYGAYELEEGQPPPKPLPTYGRTKSGRKNVKQIQVGVNVSGDGGVPLGHLPLDGNTAEASTHIDNLRELRRTLPKGKLLYIADTKLDTPENLLEVAAGDGEFLCGGAFTVDLQEHLLRNRHKLRPVAYHPKSQEKLPPEERDEYKAFERTARLRGEVQGQKVSLDYRQVFVWSEAKARQEAATRERHLTKIRAEFETVAGNLNRYSLKTRDNVLRRLEAAKAKYAEGKLFDYEVTEQRGGKLALQWGINSKRLQEWQHLEGVYVLKTNQSSRTQPLVKVLSKYKEQSQVERRIHHLKGPLAVAPMFLKNPARIAGLLCILIWALMVLALLERQVRRNLKGKPLYGLYPENRPSPAPTGPAILQCFADWCVVIVKHRGRTMRRLGEASDTQRRLLILLGIPPDRQRAFKRRCKLEGFV